MDEENDRDIVMVKLRMGGFWRFSSNEFWKKICCLVSTPTFGLGVSRLW